jgi:hypothetical protein
MAVMFMHKTSATKIANQEYFDWKFPTEEKALKHLEKIKGGRLVCPWCGCTSVSEWHNASRKDKGDGWWRCNSRRCRKQFTARHGTIFACTKMPLRTWFKVWYNMVQHGGISIKLAEELGITQETAWLMTHKIREAMRTHKEGMMLGGRGRIVEIDEAYPGGLEKFKHYKDRLFIGGGYGGKKGLLSMAERGDNGRRITVKLPEKWVRNKKGKKIRTPYLDEKTAREIVLEHIKPGTVIVTDDAKVYDILNGLGYPHFIVKHKRHQYVKLEDSALIKKSYTNTVESSHKGVKTRHRNHVHYSRKHAQRYYDETDFKWNRCRKLKEKDGTLVFAHRRSPTVKAFNDFLKGCLGKTLSYRQLVGKYRNPKKRRKRKKLK